MLKRLTIFSCISLLCVLAAGGCASDRKYVEQAREAEQRHKELASQRTPREWRPGAVWRFVTTPPPGKPQPEILTLRVTGKPGVSCLAGGGWKDVWRKFVVLGGRVPFGPPVYQVEGRALQINLSADMCDAYDIIDGVFMGGEFTGQRTTSGLGAPTEVIGTVRGSFVKR